MILDCLRCGTEFKQLAKYHLMRHDGCPKCSQTRKESRGAANVRRYLDERKIAYVNEHKLAHLPTRRYDFAFTYKGRHYIIEFDGSQHFRYTPGWDDSFEDFLYRHEIDKLKTRIALANGYIVIRLCIDDYANIIKVLDILLHKESQPSFWVLIMIDTNV